MDFEQNYITQKKLERKQQYKDIMILLTAAISIGTIWIASWGFTTNSKYETLNIVPESTINNLNEQDGRGKIWTCNYTPRAAHPTGEKIRSAKKKA